MKSYQHLIFLVLFFASFNAQGQDKTPSLPPMTSSNVIYVDGSALFIPWENFWTFGLAYVSATYDRRIYINPKQSFQLLIKSGVGLYSFGVLGPQLGLSMLTGKNNHHFEMGAGAFIGLWEIGYGATLGAFPLINLGYRFQKPEGGLIWKVKAGTTGIGAGVGWAF